MPIQPVVHLIGTSESALGALIEAAVGRNVRVRHLAAAADGRTVGPNGLVVVDLTEREPVDPEAVGLLVASADVWLVAGQRPVSARWLTLAHDPRVRVTCPSAARASGLREVARSIGRYICGPSGADVARLVVDHAPLFKPVGSLVTAVCEHPWIVRLPRDLAAQVGVSRGRLFEYCRQRGFARVEHFIIIVRMVALSLLIRGGHLSLAVARRLTGITDPSNARRQLSRARRNSPRAVRQLKALLPSVAVLLTVVLSAACRGGDGQGERPGNAAAAAVPSGDSAIALPVVGATVGLGDLILTIRTTGQVRAERQVALEAEAQGTVETVLVRPGDRVDSGQVLVRFDPQPFELTLREAEATVADATVRYRDILIGDDTTAPAPEAVERRRNARLRAGLASAEARYERARLDRDRATIRAPFAGTLDRVQAVVGQRLGAGDPIATVVDLGSLIVEAAVLEHDLLLVRRGATAAVSLAAAGGRSFSGRVAAVLPLVDTTTRAGRVLVRLRTGHDVLRPGMYADVELEATHLAGRVIVPAAAVIERDGRPLVFRYQGGRADWVYVTPGRSNGRETEILPDSASGQPAVAPGDTVLVEGHLTLTHDAPVRLTAGLEGLNHE